MIAAVWFFESCSDVFGFDDDERRWLFDAEPFSEVGMRVVVDAAEAEGLVVVASLQDLSEEAFDAAGAAVGGRVEEDEDRFRLRDRDGLREVVARLSGGAAGG